MSNRDAAAWALLLGVCAWVLAIFLAPLVITRPYSGVVAAAFPTYIAGRFICHQKPDRTFSVNGMPMPVCARCAGLYAGAIVGAAVAAARRHAGWGTSWARGVLLVAAVPTALSVAAEWIGIAPGTLVQRAAAAAPLGAAVAWVLGTAARGYLR